MFNKELVDKIDAQSKEIEKLKTEKNDIEKKFDKLYSSLKEEIPKIRITCIDTREKVQHLTKIILPYLNRIADGVDTLNITIPFKDITAPKLKDTSKPAPTPVPSPVPKTPLQRGETIYSDDQSRVIDKNLWEKFEKNFLDGKFHTIQEGKNLIKPYYKEEASDKYIIAIYNDYIWYAIHKRNFTKKISISNGTFLYRFNTVNKRKTIRLKKCDVFENSITKKVIRKYGYNFDKPTIENVKQVLNNQTTLVWNSINFKKFIKKILSARFSYVSDGRAYAYIEYFKEDKLLRLDKGTYYITKAKDKGFFSKWS